MPTASPELRARWPDDQAAMAHLRAAGYTLTPGWVWMLPTPDHKPTADERSAAQYLIEEWDFDGIDGI